MELFSTKKKKKKDQPHTARGSSTFTTNDTKQQVSRNLRQWSSSLWSYFSLCGWPVSVSAAKPFPWWCDTPARIRWGSCRTCLCWLPESRKVGAPWTAKRNGTCSGNANSGEDASSKEQKTHGLKTPRRKPVGQAVLFIPGALGLSLLEPPVQPEVKFNSLMEDV